MKVLFKMKPQGGFYGGTDFFSAQDFPFPRSDTVFQALLKAWEMLWGKQEKEELISHFHQKDSIPFFMTSIFPAIGDVYFLPRPAALEIKTTGRHKKSGNVWNTIFWISSNVYKEWLEEKNIHFFTDYFLFPGIYFHASELSSLQELCPSGALWNSDRGRMRSSLSLFSEQGYPAEQIYYSKNTEFYLVIEVQESYRKKLEAAFRLLAEEGIGGRRTIGCGSYLYREPVALPACLDFLEKPVEKNGVLLSLYYPDEENIKKGLFEKARWEIIERQGWNRNTKGQSSQNKAIRLLKEGSCFPFLPEKPTALVNVSQKEQETCYHYTYPFIAVAPGGEI